MTNSRSAGCGPGGYHGGVSDTEGFPRTLGEMIRQQRELAALPMRQLAAMAGISGPYLSQIENGLRAPSEQVLRNIAQTLGVPAEDLLGGTDGGEDGVEEALQSMRAVVRADPNLTAVQRRALLEVYRSMVAATLAERPDGAPD